MSENHFNSHSDSPNRDWSETENCGVVMEFDDRNADTTPRPARPELWKYLYPDGNLPPELRKIAEELKKKEDEERRKKEAENKEGEKKDQPPSDEKPPETPPTNP